MFVQVDYNYQIPRAMYDSVNLRLTKYFKRESLCGHIAGGKCSISILL